MFVMTLKMSKRKAVYIIIAAAVLLAAIVLLTGESDTPAQGGFDTNEGRREFLASLGWECSEEPVAEAKVLIPKEFDDVMENYNQLQKQQGFDLAPYAGLQVTQCSYEITNYPSDDRVLAQLFIYSDLLIGGDIHSVNAEGFMHGLR